MATTKATKKPNGLTITRNGMKFIFAWKVADDNYNAGQQLQWRLFNGKWTSWTSLTIATTTLSVAVSLSANNYFPAKNVFLYGLQFRVKGKRQTADGVTYNWSDWNTKTLDLFAPETPSLTQALDGTLNNVTKFTWSTPNVKNDNIKPFYDVEWQTILVKSCTQTDGSKLKWSRSTLGWDSGTGPAASSKTITEDTVLLAQNSYTRWFRVRARGCGGNGSVKGCSFWRYSKHVYAMPYLPQITKAVKEGYLNWLRVIWLVDQNPAHPIDETTVQWKIATPLANRVVPPGDDWETASTTRDTGAADEAWFLVDDAPDLDECLWVRVGVQHDRNWRATGGYYVLGDKLKAPSNLNVETSEQTYRATITVDNNSDVPDSRLAVVFRRTGAADIVVGIIPHGESSITVQCPNWSGSSAISFGVYAFQGTATGKAGSGGCTTYAVNAKMKSSTIWRGGAVPVEPSNVTAEQTETEGEVMLTWGWAWTTANRAEISWSQNPNAWESTDEPSTYMITNLNQAKWRVSGLEMGVTWYFRVRLARETDAGITYGPYCDAVPVDMSSAPSKPMLTLTKGVIKYQETFTASWSYSSTDGTPQTYAEVRQAFVSGETVTYGKIYKKTKTAQYATFNKAPSAWTDGTYYLAVRVTSASGHTSEWSDPVAIIVAPPLEMTLSDLSLEEIQIGPAGDQMTVLGLTELPLSVTVSGIGDGGTATLIVERTADYHMDRPDGSELDGYAGETVAIVTRTGDGELVVDRTDLVGRFDDGAAYTMTVTGTDEIGQVAAEAIDFHVQWTHQAGIPSATVEMLAGGVAKITPVAPASYGEGDVCDIYRLSADLPELIVEGGEFGVAYVDPYPAIGPAGGHRVVHRTVDGDYITADSRPAWVDLGEDDGDTFINDYGIISFDGIDLELRYNMSLNSSWSKDFKETAYLGGSVQGDWNPATVRTGGIDAVVPYDDLDTVRQLRQLADYNGICHVRTNDGSSYSADVQVSDDIGYDEAGKVLHYSLTVTRIDPETLDGVLFSEWS